MKVTAGQIFLLVGSLLASAGFLAPSQNHPAANLIDILPVILMWGFSLAALRFHGEIFRKDRIIVVLIPLLALAFILLLSLGYLLSFGIREFNLYSILLGWAFFNGGLYYDTRGVLKPATKKR